MNLARLSSRVGQALLRWSATLVIALMALFIIGMLRAPSLPERVPEFRAHGLNGETFDVSDAKGAPLILNFWATWCAPCRFEIPALSRFAERHPEVRVWGLSSEALPTLERAIDELSIDYPVMQVSSEVLKRFGVSTFPTTLFITATGEISSVHVGALWDPHLEAAFLGIR